MKTSRIATCLGLALVGAALLMQGRRLANWQDTYNRTYNDGLAAYQRYKTSRNPQELQTALEKFESVKDQYAAGHEGRTPHSFWYPKAERRLAALSDFHSGMIYLAMEDPERIVESWKSSLATNPGNDFAALDWGRINAAQSQLLTREANATRYNLEQLFQNNKSEAEKQGKGGKEGQRQAKKRARSQKPQNKGRQKSEKGDKPGKGKSPSSGRNKRPL